MMMENKLPIYYADICCDDDGIQYVSLVDYPAVESDFLAFAKQDKDSRLAVRFTAIEDGDTDQRMLLGVIMRADFPIYRVSENGDEFYLVFKPETVRTMAEKMLRDGRTSAVNLMHTNKMVNGVNLQELFIKDSARGLSPKGFEDIEEGSLFGVYKVHNADVWDAIKSGEFKGFSLQGFFDIFPSKETVAEELMRELDSLEAMINNHLTKNRNAGNN